MTFNDLCTEVRALGFESAEIDDSQILISARRALGVIFAEKSAKGEIEIFKLPTVFGERIPDFVHLSDNTEKFELQKKAISFKTLGNGSCRIKDAKGERRVDFSGCGEHRHFLYGEAEIEFFGEYVFSVYDLTLFDELFDRSEDKIPLASGHESYNLSETVIDFGCALSMPSDECGNPIKGASVIGSLMKIPYSYSGKVYVSYKRKPTELLGYSEEEIRMPEGCEHLLPLLVASYVWLDDDPEKSEYYMLLYREGMSTVRRSVPFEIGAEYRITDGWA